MATNPPQSAPGAPDAARAPAEQRCLVCGAEEEVAPVSYHGLAVWLCAKHRAALFNFASRARHLFLAFIGG